MGAYGGPWADQSSGGGLSGSGFIFTQLGNIPTSEITQTNVNPSKLLGHANRTCGRRSIEHPAYTIALWQPGLVYGCLDMTTLWILPSPYSPGSATPTGPGRLLCPYGTLVKSNMSTITLLMNGRICT